jgi:hypothetical protein
MPMIFTDKNEAESVYVCSWRNLNVHWQTDPLFCTAFNAASSNPPLLRDIRLDEQVVGLEAIVYSRAGKGKEERWKIEKAHTMQDTGSLRYRDLTRPLPSIDRALLPRTLSPPTIFLSLFLLSPSIPSPFLTLSAALQQQEDDGVVQLVYSEDAVDSVEAMLRPIPTQSRRRARGCCCCYRTALIHREWQLQSRSCSAAEGWERESDDRYDGDGGSSSEVREL